MEKHDWVISDSTEYHGATIHREIMSTRMGDLGGATDPVQRGKRMFMIFSFMHRHKRDPKSWAEVEEETKESIKESLMARELEGAIEGDDDVEPVAVPACPGAAASSASPAAESPKSPADGGASPTPVPKPKALPSKHKAHVESIRQVNEDGVPTGVGLLAGGGPISGLLRRSPRRCPQSRSQGRRRGKTKEKRRGIHRRRGRRSPKLKERERAKDRRGPSRRRSLSHGPVLTRRRSRSRGLGPVSQRSHCRGPAR